MPFEDLNTNARRLDGEHDENNNGNRRHDRTLLRHGLIFVNRTISLRSKRSISDPLGHARGIEPLA
jgi:hypothetical protein